jgi:alpha-tubulin suppressor-like RCC1 family protein
VVAVGTGDLFACLLRGSGAVECWGAAVLADGGASASPVPMVGLESGASALSVGARHACAVKGDGGVACWGWNDHGQLGDPNPARSFVPIDVVALMSPAISIAAGGTLSCAAFADGTTRCWGAVYPVTSAMPFRVPGLADPVDHLALGRANGCALPRDGGAMCWGENVSGVLGRGIDAALDGGQAGYIVSW